MTTVRAIGIAAALATSVACSVGMDDPPAIDVDRSACAHCGMLISELRFAAAYRTVAQPDAKVFDGIGCLLDALSRETGRSDIRFWFKDVNTEEWIDGDRAVFIQSERLHTPMAGGFAAYSDRTAAVKGAVEHGGHVIGTLDNLLREKRRGGEP